MKNMSLPLLGILTQTYVRITCCAAKSFEPRTLVNFRQIIPRGHTIQPKIVRDFSRFVWSEVCKGTYNGEVVAVKTLKNKKAAQEFLAEASLMTWVTFPLFLHAVFKKNSVTQFNVFNIFDTILLFQHFRYNSDFFSLFISVILMLTWLLAFPYLNKYVCLSCLALVWNG